MLTETGEPKKAWSGSQQWEHKEERRAGRIAAEMATKSKQRNGDSLK